MRPRRRDAGGPSKRGGGLIENHQRAVRVLLPPLERFLQQVEREIGLPGDGVAVRLINDADMTRLNATYRGKKKSTDVLSFPAEEQQGKPGSLAQQVQKASVRFL